METKVLAGRNDPEFHRQPPPLPHHIRSTHLPPVASSLLLRLARSLYKVFLSQIFDSLPVSPTSSLAVTYSTAKVEAVFWITDT